MSRTKTLNPTRTFGPAPILTRTKTTFPTTTFVNPKATATAAAATSIAPQSPLLQNPSSKNIVNNINNNIMSFSRRRSSTRPLYVPPYPPYSWTQNPQYQYQYHRRNSHQPLTTTGTTTTTTTTNPCPEYYPAIPYNPANPTFSSHTDMFSAQKYWLHSLRNQQRFDLFCSVAIIWLMMTWVMELFAHPTLNTHVKISVMLFLLFGEVVCGAFCCRTLGDIYRDGFW